MLRKKAYSRRNRGVSHMLIAWVVVMIMVIAIPITAYAAGYTVVTDEYGMLSNQEISKIEQYAARLDEYDVAVYVGGVENGQCTADNTVKFLRKNTKVSFKETKMVCSLPSFSMMRITTAVQALVISFR